MKIKGRMRMRTVREEKELGKKDKKLSNTRGGKGEGERDNVERRRRRRSSSWKRRRHTGRSKGSSTRRQRRRRRITIAEESMG